MARNNSQTVQTQNTLGVIVSNGGTVFRFNPLMPRAKHRTMSNLHPDGHGFAAPALEPRNPSLPQRIKEGLVLA